MQLPFFLMEVAIHTQARAQDSFGTQSMVQIGVKEIRKSSSPRSALFLHGCSLVEQISVVAVSIFGW